MPFRLFLPPRWCGVMTAFLTACAGLRGVTALGPVVVTATRSPQSVADVAASLRVFDAAEIENAPSATVDGLLRGAPAFTLFRRSDSLTAHPTAQGVSLRGLGPSGASRSLVLFDGVPLNDPFGGWVTWSKLPREQLQMIEVVPGGGASAWGNAALGGVVHLRSPRAVGPGTRLAAIAGDYGLHSIELAHTSRYSRAELSVQARLFGLDGFHLVAPERRGSIDEPAWSRHRWVSARWRQPVAHDLAIVATVRAFEEKRGNGTPYQSNRTRETFGTLGVTGQPREEFLWSLDSYVQSQTFASTFGAVNAARTSETPASDQFDVPSTAFGASWIGAWRHRDHARTTFGADARFVRGETRENATYSAALAAFTRQRIAGGEQTVAGMFALHERPLAPNLRLTLGARFDSWADADGHRRESDTVNGTVIRDEDFGDRSGAVVSPSLGLVWTPKPAWRVRASAQRAFRRPTLNELYRPFRVGPNITEANARLDTEHVVSAEVGAEWRLFARDNTTPSRENSESAVVLTPFPAPQPREQFTLGATVFWNEIRDAVGNVTLAQGPGAFPLFGFVPAGGVGRQRQNLERLRTRGIEISATWEPTRILKLTADYLYNDATVTRASNAPNLIGNRVAQVPRHSLGLGGMIAMSDAWSFTPRVRWIDRQFEDDENRLVLGEVVIADLTVTYVIDNTSEFFVTVENLGDARIETGRTADGLVNIGAPRLAFGGVRLRW